jgi:thimet oligopeptidase
MKYRRTVLDPGGSQPGKEIVQKFLGRSQSTEPFTNWISEEFQPTAAVYD